MTRRTAQSPTQAGGVVLGFSQSADPGRVGSNWLHAHRANQASGMQDWSDWLADQVAVGPMRAKQWRRRHSGEKKPPWRVFNAAAAAASQRRISSERRRTAANRRLPRAHPSACAGVSRNICYLLSCFLSSALVFTCSPWCIILALKHASRASSLAVGLVAECWVDHPEAPTWPCSSRRATRATSTLAKFYPSSRSADRAPTDRLLAGLLGRAQIRSGFQIGRASCRERV